MIDFIALLKNPIFSILVFGIIPALIIIAIVAIRAMPAMPYLYLSAIVQSRSKGFLTDSKKRLLYESKGLYDFGNNLNGTLFCVQEKSRSTVQKTHAALETEFHGLVDEVSRLAPKKMQDVISAYFLLSEAALLKSLFRIVHKKEKSSGVMHKGGKNITASKSVGSDIDIESISPSGSISKQMIKELTSADSTLAFVNQLSGTGYEKLVGKKYETAEDFDIAVDNLAVERISNICLKLKINDKKLVKRILELLVDSRNIGLVLQGIIRKDKIKLISFGSIEWHAVLEKADYKNLEKDLKRSQYSSSLLKALEEYQKDGKMYHFDLAMNRLLQKFVSDNLLQNSQGAFSIMSYIVRLDIDRRNLFMISKLVDSGMKGTKIQDYLI